MTRKQTIGFKIKKSIRISSWQLSRLKYKTMVLVMSLIEMNTDKSALKRIMRSLPLGLLKKNLMQIYFKYKKFYKKMYVMDIFNHFEGEPKNKEEEKYYDVIVETGFNIYFVILGYMDMDGEHNDDDSSELHQLLTESSASNQILNIQNNLVGQLLLFAQEILNSLLHYINKVISF